MTKRIIIALCALITALCFGESAFAQGREFRSTKSKTKVEKTVTETPFEVAPENGTNKPKVKKGDKQPSSSVNVSTISSATTKSTYAALLNEQTAISTQIEVLSAQLQGAKRGKAKKISKQINELTTQLNSIERRMATFPRSITNPAGAASIMEVDQQFNRQLDSLIAIRVAQSDPYADRLSNDPELESMYRSHLQQNGENPLQGHQGGGVQISDELTFRVMIAISKNPLPASAFKGLDNILQQRMPNGGMVYYQGSYATQGEADKACGKILASQKFRDAFVVAMQGDKRVPLP